MTSPAQIFSLFTPRPLTLTYNLKDPYTNIFTDQNNSTESSDSAPSKNQRSRLFRSQSITDQLNKTPRVAPNWGHSLSKSYGGNDWPLPASKATNPGSSPHFAGLVTLENNMYSMDVVNEQARPASKAPKKRGPKPKNEPAASVTMGLKQALIR